MKILFVNKFYYMAGGQEFYLRELQEILTANGHEIIPFAMEHPRNWETPYSKYFVRRIDISSTDAPGLIDKVRMPFRLIYSREARQKLDALIRATRPDIAHIYSVNYQLTPSVMYALKEHGIPVVNTVNEYKLVCPNQRLFVQHTGENCELCLGSNYRRAVSKRCIKDSLGASIVGAVESRIYDSLGTFRDNVDAFIVATDYMREVLEGVRIRPEKVVKILHPLRLTDYKPDYTDDGYVLYFGRLSGEKGLKTLIRAFRGLDVPLKLMGEGPDTEELKAMVRDWGMDNVEFLGFRQGAELRRVIARSRLVVCPSEWYENSPYVVYESLATGKPVIGSSIKGGIPELVKDGKDGFLFRPMDPDDLREKVRRLYYDEGMVGMMGRYARKYAEDNFGEDASYRNFMALYERVIKTHGRGKGAA